MKNLWTVARKELRTYFDHPTAYILLVVFLGINFFFYFRSAFLIGEASLRPLFDLLPWIFLFFVPAVTMGALAEERRHGTLEVALSHPLHDHEFLLGKYVGNLLFIAIALAGTLLVPILLLLGGTPDLGVVIAQYVGALFLAAGMSAVGIFASALTRNQITAFIVGTAVIFILVMAGTEVVQIGLPGWLVGTVGQLGILNHFSNVARGVIDLRDVVYFVSLAAAFLALAYWRLLADRLSHGSRLYRNLKLGTAMIVAIAVVANLFGRYIPGRIDLTAENLYTISDGTRQILSGLDDVITLTLYASDELPAQVRPLARDVNDVLRDFKRYGGGNIQVVRKSPDASDEARREAQQAGIRPVQFNVMSREEFQLKQGWMGIAIRYADQTESIPFVGDTRNLEYQLAANVWRMTREDVPRVAFITGHGEKGPGDYASFNRQLRETYDVTTVDLSADTTLLGPDLDAVVVAGPKQAMGDRARRQLKQYLARDGRLFYLGEGADVNLQFLFAAPLPDSVRDFPRTFGVRLNSDLVFDLRSNEMITVPGEVFSVTMAYPFWVRALPAEEHPITRNLNSIFLPWASSLDSLATFGGREFTPLLSTSQYAWHQTQSFQIRPDEDVVYERDQLRPHVLAFAVKGAVPAGAEAVPAATTMGGSEPTGGIDAGGIEAAAGPAGGDARTGAESEGAAGGQGDATDGAPGSAQEPEPTQSQAPQGSDAPEQPDTVDATPRVIDKEVFEGPPSGRVVVVGDADFLDDRFMRNAPENLVFAMNTLDWLTQTDALLNIRSKTPTPRPLVFESNFEKQAVKYLNLIGVPLAFVLFGTVRLVRRRRLTRRTYGS